MDNLYKIRNWCQQYRVAFKINSVINTFNVDEDMVEHIVTLNPVRWKVRMEKGECVYVFCASLSPDILIFFVCPSCGQVFQCLLIDGENAGEEALREAERFIISDTQFQEFLDRHSSVPCLVPESNEKV